MSEKYIDTTYEEYIRSIRTSFAIAMLVLHWRFCHLCCVLCVRQFELW